MNTRKSDESMKILPKTESQKPDAGILGHESTKIWILAFSLREGLEMETFWLGQLRHTVFRRVLKMVNISFSRRVIKIGKNAAHIFANIPFFILFYQTIKCIFNNWIFSILDAPFQIIIIKFQD